MEFDGLSGRIRYENGERYDFNLDLMQLTQNGLKEVSVIDLTAFVVDTCEYVGGIDL